MPSTVASRQIKIAHLTVWGVPNPGDTRKPWASHEEPEICVPALSICGFPKIVENNILP